MGQRPINITVGMLDIKSRIAGKTTMGVLDKAIIQTEEEDDDFAFLTLACMVTSGEAALGTVKWYLDSEATDHMVKEALKIAES